MAGGFRRLYVSGRFGPRDGREWASKNKELKALRRISRPGYTAISATAVALVLSTGPAEGCHGQWLPRFVDMGMDNIVSALAAFDDGNGPALYAGGAFFTAGGTTVNKVARLQGNQWLPLGSGIMEGNGQVWVMMEYDDGSGKALLVAGDFTIAGGKVVNRIGRWDGSEWSPVGGGTNATIRGAMTVFDDGSGPALYVGGDFTTAGDGEAKHIAKWDGQEWSGVGGGMDGVVATVRTLLVFDDGSGPALYAGGNFASAGGVTVGSIARWDGTQWADVGGGVWAEDMVSRLVRGLAVHDDGSGPALYATGQFTHAGGVEALKIARWDGQKWSAVGGGFASDAGLPATGRRLAVFDDGEKEELYVCGEFTRAGGQTVNYITKWDGEQWSALESGLNKSGLALTVFDEGDGPALFVGGAFTTTGGLTTLKIGKWRLCPEGSDCPADLDQSGTVDVLDLLALLGAWGPCPHPPAACPGDVIVDGTVDVLDLLALLEAWGPCPDFPAQARR